MQDKNAQEPPILSEVTKSSRRLKRQPESGDGEVIDILLAHKEKFPVLPAETHVEEFDKKLAPESLTNGIPEFDEGISSELMEVFFVEVNEHLQNITHSLSTLDKNPKDKNLLQEVRRGVHTIKGAAGMVGLQAVSHLSHRMEDLLDKLYDGEMELSPDIMNLLFMTSDTLDDIVSAKFNDKDSGIRLQKLYELYGRLLETKPYDKPTVSKTDFRKEDENVATWEDKIVNPSDAGSHGIKEGYEQFGKDTKQTIRKPGEFVRIPIERLDELVNLVSELVVNRSTFEQHFGRFIQEVGELQPSVDRLRRASTKMETGYEVNNLERRRFANSGKAAVGMSISKPVASSIHEFDELEFDRYTEFHLLSRELTETTNDIDAVGNELRDIIGDFDSYLDRQGRLTGGIQDKLMRLRMVPLATLVTRLHRTVRVRAAQQGKIADFVIEGEDVELDNTVLEEMADPLLHILRNSVDHGIEPQYIRRVMGKPENGQIWLRAYYEGTQVVIQVRDDGAGLDPELLRSTAARGGFVSEADVMNLSDEELYSLVFLPGFSTAKEISEISGRGVGMDIVKSTVHKMKGAVSVNSTRGKGTIFIVRLPITLI
jgi:chemosensory pili system protein ChpA (sensor histidine kinase/response regulator)